jgi:hypothetical protein
VPTPNRIAATEAQLEPSVKTALSAGSDDVSTPRDAVLLSVVVALLNVDAATLNAVSRAV